MEIEQWNYKWTSTYGSYHYCVKDAERVGHDRVEVRSANHAQFTALRRGSDGTFTDDGGFGEGEFTLRVVGVDGSTSEETFSSFTPGELVRGSRNL